MYPIKFKSVYFEKLWGGRDFQEFRDDLPNGCIGESWDICSHPNGMGIATNGIFKGMSLEELIKKEGHRLVGNKMRKEPFPLLIKLINAKDTLSVQVHPNDDFALEREGEMGKTEAWYIVDAKVGASIVLGTKTSNKEDFLKALESNDLDKYLNRIYVKKGEVYFVRSGLIHAIEQGVVIVEIQQNSDTTYRVYDYGRGRELHISKAMEVVDFDIKGEKSEGLKVEREGYSRTFYCLDKNFSLELYQINGVLIEKTDPERFWVFTCVDGAGVIFYQGGKENIAKGDSIFFPASLGIFKVEGNLRLIKSYVPDKAKVEREILNIIRS